MRRSQELTIKLSEARERLNKAIEKRNALGDKDPDAELLAEMDAASKAISPLEIEMRAAIHAEAAEDETAARDNPDGEQRELEKIENRCSVTAYMREGSHGTRLRRGRSRIPFGRAGGKTWNPVSCRCAFSATRYFPKWRSAPVTPGRSRGEGAGQPSRHPCPACFERSIASALGVAMPTVPMGTRTYPVYAHRNECVHAVAVWVAGCDGRQLHRA